MAISRFGFHRRKSISGAITPQKTQPRVKCRSSRLARPLAQRGEPPDRTGFVSDPPAYPGIVDRKTSGIIFLPRTERHLMEISMSEPKQTKPLKRGRGRPRLFDR